MFRLSQRSLKRLQGVKDPLAAVVMDAIHVTKVDFGVTAGLRTEEEQRQMVAQGRSQTMKSKHLTGDAVDLVAYFGREVSWDAKVYDEICDAMAQIAKIHGTAIKWGGAWTEGDIGQYPGTAEEAHLAYVDLRRSQGRRPFIDMPHFELI